MIRAPTDPYSPAFTVLRSRPLRMLALQHGFTKIYCSGSASPKTCRDYVHFG